MATFMLVKEEILELRNVTLRKALLEAQIRREQMEIHADQLETESKIASRLGIGSNLAGAQIDLQKGILEIKVEEKSKEAKQNKKPAQRQSVGA